jgi:hypothetical protein
MTIRTFATTFAAITCVLTIIIAGMWGMMLKHPNLATAYSQDSLFVPQPAIKRKPITFDPVIVGSYASNFYERGGLLFWKVYTIYTYPHKTGRTIVVSEYNASTNGAKEAKHVINASGRDANHRVKVYLGLIKEDTIVGSDLKYTGQGQELDIWDHYFDLSGVRLGDPVFFNQYKAQ